MGIIKPSQQGHPSSPLDFMILYNKKETVGQGSLFFVLCVRFMGGTCQKHHVTLFDSVQAAKGQQSIHFETEWHKRS